MTTKCIYATIKSHETNFPHLYTGTLMCTKIKEILDVINFLTHKVTTETGIKKYFSAEKV